MTDVTKGQRTTNDEEHAKDQGQRTKDAPLHGTETFELSMLALALTTHGSGGSAAGGDREAAGAPGALGETDRSPPAT